MDNKMKSEKLREIIQNEMNQFDETRNYYAFTFTANENGLITFSTQTRWNGWADDKHINEIRVPSLVKPEVMIKDWQLIKQPFLVVNKDEH
jgi:hypothetical protein